MGKTNEHVIAHPRTGMFWFRRTVPARLRPVLPPVDLFPNRPNRTEFTIILRTKDPRKANAAAAKYEIAVDQALHKAEGLAEITRRTAAATAPIAGAGADRPGTGLPMASLPAGPLIRPADAFAAIGDWVEAELHRLELIAFNRPAGRTPEDCAACKRLIALAEQVDPVNKAPCPPEADAKLVEVLAGAGLGVTLDHPVVEKLRHEFRRQWAIILDAEGAALLGMPVRPGRSTGYWKPGPAGAAPVAAAAAAPAKTTPILT